MASMARDLLVLVNELCNYCARLQQPDNDTLTSIQKQGLRDELAREMKRDGISFERLYNDGNPKINFTWSPPIVVSGTGSIADVSALGAFPIRLSVGDQVSVYFEPRNLGKTNHFERNKIGNSEFADLKKGSAYEFQGMTGGCAYYFGQASNGRFEFNVERGDGAGTNEGAIASFFRDLFG